jgi:hypothetical protein
MYDCGNTIFILQSRGLRHRLLNVFLLLFVALWVPISATLFRRAVPTLWHAFLVLGLIRFFPLVFFLLGGLHCFSLIFFLLFTV